MPEINMPEISVPKIKLPEYKMPQFKPVETGSNIGAAVRTAIARYNAEKEAINAAVKTRHDALVEFEKSITAQQEDIKKTFEKQYREQMQAIPKQQKDILKQRTGLPEQQPPLLAKQTETIALLNDMENLYKNYF